jgi:hypothetical protein
LSTFSCAAAATAVSARITDDTTKRCMAVLPEARHLFSTGRLPQGRPHRLFAGLRTILVERLPEGDVA